MLTVSFEAFLRIIDTPALRRFVDRKRNAVEAIDPQRIYVENVRAFFGFPHSLARLLLETAVREGALERRVGLLCPYDQHIIKSLSSGDETPDAVLCLVCEAEGREGTHPRSTMGMLTFYRLVETSNG